MNFEPFVKDPEPGFLRVKFTMPPDMWGKPVQVLIPEPFWSNDYVHGKRGTVWLGTLCSHSGPESDVCVQPVNQGQSPSNPCVPFDPEKCLVQVLAGKLSDYL